MKCREEVEEGESPLLIAITPPISRIRCVYFLPPGLSVIQHARARKELGCAGCLQVRGKTGLIGEIIEDTVNLAPWKPSAHRAKIQWKQLTTCEGDVITLPGIDTPSSTHVGCWMTGILGEVEKWVSGSLTKLGVARAPVVLGLGRWVRYGNQYLS